MLGWTRLFPRCPAQDTAQSAALPVPPHRGVGSGKKHARSVVSTTGVVGVHDIPGEEVTECHASSIPAATYTERIEPVPVPEHLPVQETAPPPPQKGRLREKDSVKQQSGSRHKSQSYQSRGLCLQLVVALD